MGETGKQSHHAGDVVACFAGRLGVAEHEVLDQGGVEVGHLGQDGLDHLHGHVVWSQGAQGSLERPADGAAGGGGDDSFRHGSSSVPIRVGTV